MRILAIAPHPDDETLGCCGTLLKHKANGDSLSWLIVTRGHEPRWSAEILSEKDREIDRVASLYGFEQVFRLNFPTVKLETLALEDVINEIRNVLSEWRPDYVYLNNGGDVHSDHRLVYEAAMAALKPFY